MRLGILLLFCSLQNGLHSYHPDMYKNTINDVIRWFSPSNADQTILSSTAPPTSTLSEHQQAILSFVNANQELFSKMDQTIPSSTAPPTSTLSEQQQACMSFFNENRELFSKMDQTIRSSSAPPSSNLLDIDVAHQLIPSPSPSDEKLSILEKENTVQEEHSESDSHTTQQPIPSPTSGNSSLSDHPQKTNSTEEEGSGSTLLDSDFIALLEIKSSELLESTQKSIVEKQEEHKAEEKHEASSTEPSETTTPIPTTTSTPLNDTIFDVSETCDSDAICYVAPKDCTTNCEVIYAVSEKSNNATIYVKEGGVVHIKTSLAYKAGERRKVPNPRHTMISCFEASGNCWQAYEAVYIYEDRPSGYIGYGNYPLGQTTRRQEPKHQNWWYFARLYNKGPILEVGSHRILEYRRDPHSDANFGPFHALFLRSKE
ncbi:hypothetical protein B9Z55_026176 [Caenorhabditis nigoni]|uniref:SUN domain-containing protein n=1 Tax=Caenorhabditis nigoni TaxID=1611254 RepID=A0A2G5T297_9PELO|nr:hypothetical protein B9Z55_026176 [Caenorhabditis nigoni]